MDKRALWLIYGIFLLNVHCDGYKYAGRNSHPISLKYLGRNIRGPVDGNSIYDVLPLEEAPKQRTTRCYQHDRRSCGPNHFCHFRGHCHPRCGRDDGGDQMNDLTPEIIRKESLEQMESTRRRRSRCKREDKHRDKRCVYHDECGCDRYCNCRNFCADMR